MTDTAKAHEDARKARELAEAQLRACELKVASQTEVAAGYEKALQEAIRKGQSPGRGLNQKRREHRDLIVDLRHEAEATRTVVAERREEERRALVAMERERRALLRQRAADVAGGVREALSALRELAGELDGLHKQHRRSLDKVRGMPDSGPSDPDLMGSVLKPAEVRVLAAL